MPPATPTSTAERLMAAETEVANLKQQCHDCQTVTLPGIYKRLNQLTWLVGVGFGITISVNAALNLLKH